MKKIILSLLLLVQFSTAKEIDLAPFKKLKMFSDGRLILKRAFDHGSIYAVQFVASTPQGPRNFKAYITKDKKILIAGEGIVIATGEALSMPKQDLNMKEIAKDADIVYGTGKTKLIVVTDPECYYCQVFQQRWPELKRKYTLYVYLYPLSHHKQANMMSYHVLKQTTHAKKAKALIQIAKDAKKDRMNPSGPLTTKAYTKTKVSKKEQIAFDAKLEKNSLLGDMLGVRGTPSVFDSHGDAVIWNKLF